ncbi:Calcineurin-like phosphoesterase [Aspergillus sclerotialis]|uniref:Calcineurin-like phosphoesterase n=1 Tax=Aspergillus sclerotialis TaxID=2070753 RepID=A0A3A2ZWC3_9EURO|nr:Calcineurin-like phosphoesterase [Aspergillus sclerotialis]
MAGKSISRPIIGPPKQDSFIQSTAKSLLSWHEQHHPSKSSTSNPNIKIICIADTHNTQPTLPDGDILLHAGDLSQYGTFDEIQNQLTWLNSQPHRWKVVIGGNHDLLLDQDFVSTHPDRELEKPGKTCKDLHWGDVIYLHNSSIELDVGSRKIKVYGCPLTPQFGNFAFQYLPIKDVWKNTVPLDTDVLLTHGPPVGWLDGNGKGCGWLLDELWRVRQRLVVFGHVHVGRGQRCLGFDDVEACYANILRDKRPGLILL